jgi:hypothetical protein
MTNCRVQLFFSISFFLFALTGFHSSAQVATNKTGLQKASQDRTLQEAAFQKILTRTALEKGWPLTLRNKKGRLAYLRGVNNLGLPYYITTTDNLISAATIRTNKVWPGGGAGLTLNGSTAALKGKIAVWDEGLVRSTHVELNGRVTQKDNATALSDHSTHVSGTMIAAGVNPLAKGMSFGAQQLLAYDFNNDEAEMMSAAAGGLLVSSHSYADIAGWYIDASQNDRWEFWGNPGDTVDIRFGLYNEDARIWDSIAYMAPDYLIAKAGGNNRGETGPSVGQLYYRMNAQGNFVSAGNRPAGISSNDGYSTIATYGNSKNILTLGAVSPIPGGYNSPSDVVLADFSSMGPTGDGRIKPDLVADGVNVLSSVSSSDRAYDIFSGTSMATPAAAGSSFLLQEYYSKLHNGAFMHSSTLKGLLIHTADEAGANPGPDYAFGWGLINMERAAAVVTADNTDQSQRIVQSSLSGTGPATYTIVASGKTPVVATLCWTDVPGTPATVPASSHNFKDAGIKLVNDLDLRITDNTTGKIYLPWILDPANPGAAATKGDNIRDNVEKVELSDSLIPGRQYTIAVSHKGTLTGTTQTYSLLIGGGGGTAVCASASAASGADITQLTVGAMTNNTPVASGCRNYTDYSGLAAASLPVGQNVPVSIVTDNCPSVATDNTRFVKIYIDFNGDGTFDPVSELAYQSPAGQAGSLSGTLTVPTTAVPGSYARMRVIVEEATDPTAITPCGTYPAGETQDYKVVFTHPASDVGVTTLEYPTQTSCANDSQLVSIRIHNFGSATQAGGIPVTTVITGGASPITLSAICKDSLLSGAEVVFTYNTPIATAAGVTYTYTSKTALSGDLNTSNDGNTTLVNVNTAEAAGSGNATVCGENATTVVLHAATTGLDIPVWYESATSTVPLAAGNNTTTSVITSNKTYYLGLNDLEQKAGAPNKMAFTSTSANQGSYFRFGGNFMMFTTSVPLTIESAKMYIGHSGKITLTLATLASLDNSNGRYSYFPLYNTTIDVFATKAVPDTSTQINVPAGDNSDTGATYLLNIPVPTPGDYIIIIDCSSTTNAFVNININKDPYPLTIPGIISITGNDFRDYGKADSVTASHKFYYPFYNMGIRLGGCPSPRTAIVAKTEPAPVITLSGNTFTSNSTTNNQWYVNDSLLVGHNGQTDSATIPGVYYTVVTDPSTGCSLTSNKITYTPSGGDPNASIGLSTYPNPSTGVFQLQFFMSTTENTSISLTDMLGQRVYEAQYPNFSGLFSQQINAASLASGIYTLRIIHGGQTYHKELLVVKK